MGQPAEIVQKVVGHQNIVFKNGEVLIWNIPVIITPMNTYILLEQLGREMFGKPFQDLVYYSAFFQAKGGTEVLQKQFGFKEPRKAVDLELQTSEMVGLGSFKLMKYDEKNKMAIIKIENTPYVQQYLSTLGNSSEPVDHWLRGAVAGIFSFAFGTTVVAIETSCKALGKKDCVIEVKEAGKWDKNDPLIKAQFPENEEFLNLLIQKQTAQSMRKKQLGGN